MPPSTELSAGQFWLRRFHSQAAALCAALAALTTPAAAHNFVLRALVHRPAKNKEPYFLLAAFY